MMGPSISLHYYFYIYIIIEINSGITRGRVLNGEPYT